MSIISCHVTQKAYFFLICIGKHIYFVNKIIFTLEYLFNLIKKYCSMLRLQCNNTHGPIHKVMLKLKKGGPPPHMTVE